MAVDSPDQSDGADLRAALEDSRKRFLVTVKEIRPRLHRFCTRMCASVLDGEDLVQEVLAQAFYSLSSLKDESRLEPWLFRIAHNKSVDFLRREKRQQMESVPYDDEQTLEHVPDAGDPANEPVDEALAMLVAELPPMERACVLLKDVLDYRLAEIADVVDSTLGGVKAALHRGRAKLRLLHQAPSAVELDREQRRLLDEYLDRFNRRDWDALRRLIRADARVELVGVKEFTLLDAPYLQNYAALPWEWKLSVARVDGEPLVVHWRKVGPDWVPFAAIRIWWRDGQVVRIRDYIHVEYLLGYSRTEEETRRASPGL
ncbi:MAG: sigma-70 family RNA polymerase sigma factor [Gemmatimonadota bacterium]